MPVFLIERNLADQPEINPEAAAAVNKINGDAGVDRLVSFLRADKKKTHCLCEAPSADAIREAARVAGLPADEIVEVGEISSLGRVGAVQKERYAAQ